MKVLIEKLRELIRLLTFRCTHCGHPLEFFWWTSSKTVTKCPGCGRMRKW